MKNTIIFLKLFVVVFLLGACTNEDLIVHYPQSTPIIDTALVRETQIMYGDSIHIQLGLTDKVAPLSTVLIRIVVNNEIVESETIRTKGNHASIKRTYGIPFVANRPDNEPVKLYLTLTNVEGFTKDSIISTTIAKRPILTDFWVVPDFGQGGTYKLALIDAKNLIYKATGLSFTTSVSYKIATKLNAFNRIDWSGMVFGKVGDGIGVVDQNGLSITSTDESLVGISELTFDALKFTTKVGGKLLEPILTLNVNTELIPIVMSSQNFRGGSIYFGEGVETTFTGISGPLANGLSPDYFEVTGTNTAKFLGKTGLYKAYYLIDANYLYIEPLPDAIYPDALWICGIGFGRPSAPYTTTASWNWNSPLDYAPCRLVSPGIYQVTVYVKNVASTDATSTIGTLNFKFFDKRGWWDGHEQLSTDYSVSAPLVSSTVANNVGNVIGLGSNPFEGVYRITLNQNNKTIKAQKMN